MIWHPTAQPVPRSDGTTPNRKLDPAKAKRIRETLANKVGRRRATAIRKLMAELHVSETVIRRVAEGSLW